MAVIEEDNGGHLIGTVYPGKPINLEQFEISEAWAAIVAPAEAGLLSLRQSSQEEFETFVIGEFTEVERLVATRPDLAPAHKLLNDWFNGFDPEDAPRG